MWPKYLDMNDEECSGVLRRLELEAYSSVVSAFRAQGELTKERRKVLQDLSTVLNVTIDRHKAEVRRAVNDELLNTIAASVCGTQSEQEWAKEGRRIIPLLRRATPITKFTAVVNAAKKEVENRNKLLMPPIKTQTPRRSRGQRTDENSRKNTMHPTPPNLEDILIRTKDEEGKNRLCAIPPNISVPNPPPSYKSQVQDFYGGDVVTLPSGMAIRVMESVKKEEESKKAAQNKRKRKSSFDMPAPNAKQPTTSFEILRPPPGLPHLFPQHIPHQLYPLPQRMPPPSLPTNFQLGGQPLFTKGPMPPPAHGGLHTLRPPLIATPIPAKKGRTPGSGKVKKPKAPEKISKKALQQHLKAPLTLAGTPRPVLHPPNCVSFAPTTLPISSLGPIITGQLKAVPIKTVRPDGKPLPVPKTALISAQKPTMANLPAEPEDLSKSLPLSTTATSQTTTSTVVPTKQQIIKTPAPLTTAKVKTTSSLPATLTTTTVSENGLVKTSVAGSTNGSLKTATQVSPRIAGTPIKLKEVTSSTVSGISTMAATLAASGMKVIPAGAARILPKPGGSTPQGTPIYMVAASTPGQNIVRVARTVAGSTANAIMAGTTTTQRVVTLSAAALRSPAVVTFTAASGIAPGTTLRPGTNAQIVRALQPRGLATAIPSGAKPLGTPSKPSVIVVQRGHGTPRGTLVSKDLPIGHRLIPTPKASIVGAGKPLVVVTKPTATPLTTTSTLANASGSKSGTGQGNVIVLDLSQQELTGNAMLSDILQASGIFPEEEDAAANLPVVEQPLSKSEVSETVQKPPKNSEEAAVEPRPAAAETVFRSQLEGAQAVVRREEKAIDIVSAAFVDADLDPNHMEIQDEPSKSQSDQIARETLQKTPLQVSTKLKPANVDTPSTGESIEDISNLLTDSTVPDEVDDSRQVGEVGDEVVGEDEEPPPMIKSG